MHRARGVLALCFVRVGERDRMFLQMQTEGQRMRTTLVLSRRASGKIFGSSKMCGTNRLSVDEMRGVSANPSRCKCSELSWAVPN